MPTQIAPGDIVRRHEDAPAGRAPLLVVDPLLEFLDRRGLGSGEPAIEPLGDGHSNYTYTLAREGSTVVLRRPPRPPYPKSAHDVLREARLLRAMARTDVPVPNVLAICEDRSIIGVPFYVMEKLNGIVYTDRTPPQLDAPDERQRVADELVDALVKLHAVDWRAAGLQDFGRPAGYLERQLRRFADLLETYRSREIPALDRLTVWLREHRPVASAAAIVHGDFRLGNVMFEAQAPARLIAIFDWEMATLGDPLADVGYMCGMWAHAWRSRWPAEALAGHDGARLPDARRSRAEVCRRVRTLDPGHPLVHGPRAVEVLRDHGGELPPRSGWRH